MYSLYTAEAGSTMKFGPKDDIYGARLLGRAKLASLYYLRDLSIIPSDMYQRLHFNKAKVHYFTHFPLNACVQRKARLAMARPGSSGSSKIPFRCASLKNTTSASSMAPAYSSLSCRCISVSTIPGCTATVQMAGSSTARVIAKLFRDALDALYGPQATCPVSAAPDEVSTMQPRVRWRYGIASRIYVWSLARRTSRAAGRNTIATIEKKLISKADFHSSVVLSEILFPGCNVPWFNTSPSMRLNVSKASVTRRWELGMSSRSPRTILTRPGNFKAKSSRPSLTRPATTTLTLSAVPRRHPATASPIPIFQ